MPMMRARGVKPWALAAASLATIIAAAPSFNPLALPAVIVPSACTTGLRRGQRLQRCGAGVFVGGEEDGVALFLRQSHRHDFGGGGHWPARLRLLLAGQSKSILRLAADAPLLRHIFAVCGMVSTP
jgi:hypothetical protein